MALYVVATPIGNLNDFSKRAINVLNNCDLILAEDTRQTIKLLNHFEIKKKMQSYHKFNESKVVDGIIEKLKNNMNIALVSDAGTPCISDPGYILVKKAREENLDVYGVPGASAVIDALSICGLDTSSFSFYGFVSTENKQKKKLFEKIKTSDVKCKIIYESPKRIVKTLQDLVDYVPDCNICVLRELTKVHEKCFYGKIKDVINTMKEDSSVQKGEYVVIINNDAVKKESSEYSIESKLINIMVSNKCSLKDAIGLLKAKDDTLSKKDIYNASLNLKDILNVK